MVLYCMDIHIHVKKRHLYFLSLLVLIIGSVLFVRGQSSGFGHSAEDVYVNVNGAEYALQEVIDGMYNASWEMKDVETVYQAEQNGFVIVNPSNQGHSDYRIHTGEDGESLVRRVYAKSSQTYHSKNPSTILIRKGEYWKVELVRGHTPHEIWWVAFGV